jgi:hypothetical protein
MHANEQKNTMISRGYNFYFPYDIKRLCRLAQQPELLHEHVLVLCIVLCKRVGLLLSNMVVLVTVLIVLVGDKRSEQPGAPMEGVLMTHSYMLQ